VSPIPPGKEQWSWFDEGRGKAMLFITDNEMWVPAIMSRIPGVGIGSKMLTRIEELAKEHKVKTIIFPTVLSLLLVNMLKKRGFKELTRNMGEPVNDTIETFEKVLE
jgi:N-acetylglutamate synthase-like GNAT family acetyltransferase